MRQPKDRTPLCAVGNKVHLHGRIGTVVGAWWDQESTFRYEVALRTGNWSVSETSLKKVSEKPPKGLTKGIA